MKSGMRPGGSEAERCHRASPHLVGRVLCRNYTRKECARARHVERAVSPMSQERQHEQAGVWGVLAQPREVFVHGESSLQPLHVL